MSILDLLNICCQDFISNKVISDKEEDCYIVGKFIKSLHFSSLYPKRERPINISISNQREGLEAGFK